MGNLDIASKARFTDFLQNWNTEMRQDTPQIHLKMARWLERRWEAGDKRLLMMAFRSAGKSTITGVFCAWLLYQNPNLRILVLAAEGALAKKMVRNVKRIIERHPNCAELKPEKRDQWGMDCFTVRRDQELRDPSMLARGITSNITGSRADFIICDDVEVPNTSDSADKRESLRERLAEMNYVMAAGASQLYVGTPHTFYTIYAQEAREEIGEERAFLEGFERIEVPLLDDDGRSNWPERITEEDAEILRLTTGNNRFTSQMLLKPVNINEGRLNTDLLKFYEGEIDHVREINTMFLGGKKLEKVSVYWDPAFGTITGDHSVVAVVYEDADGALYLHHLEYIKTQETKGHNEAERQCAIVANLCKELKIPTIIVESNGIGKFLPGILRQEMQKAKTLTNVVEFNQSESKERRILNAFDAVLTASRLSVHERIKKTPFIMEVREWRPDGHFKGRDDALDAVAGALLRLPSQSKICHPRGRYRWTAAGVAHKAKVDFEM
ncbi:MAG: phage terminase large subunit [Micavibrio sp.]|nr:phage terminase large subunit [Micavibrio sp.]